MIVVDASVGANALLVDGASRSLLASQPIHAPTSIDVEVASVLRRLALAGAVDDRIAANALDRWAQLGIVRWSVATLVPRMWELRHSVTAYDAAYVALAEVLAADLVTADRRLAQAHGLRCIVRVVQD